MNTIVKKMGAAICLLLFVIIFSGIRNISSAKDQEKSPQKEIILSDSTIEGSVLQPMKIPLISLDKERKERIQLQLNQKVQIKKRFNNGQQSNVKNTED